MDIRRPWAWLVPACIVILQGCASASAGGTQQPAAAGCRGQNATASCYGGPP